MNVGKGVCCCFLSSCILGNKKPYFTDELRVLLSLIVFQLQNCELRMWVMLTRVIAGGLELAQMRLFQSYRLRQRLRKVAGCTGHMDVIMVGHGCSGL